MDASNTDAAVDRTAMQTHQAQLCRIGEAVAAAHHRRRLPIALQAHRNVMVQTHWVFDPPSAFNDLGRERTQQPPAFLIAISVTWHH